MIQSSEQLAGLLPKLERAEWMALDTEADSLHAYPEKLCLLQLSIPDLDVLIDPLAGCDLSPLLRLLGQKELVLHGADYDLRLLHRTFQFVPGRIFDTMWAARLLGFREFGLRHLVQEHLGVALEKGPQKMNWALRPLSVRMATYALNDTRHLRPLAEILRGRLKASGRLTWQEEVCSSLVKECAAPRTRASDSPWRIKGSDRLDARGMAVLRELWQWREEEALAANKPPYFVFSHERLVALSAAVARDRPIQGLIPHHMPPKRVGRLTAAVAKALKIPPTHYPQPRRATSARMSPEQRSRFERLKTLRDARALELGLDPTIIASKADLASLAQEPHKGTAKLLQWQRELLDA